MRKGILMEILEVIIWSFCTMFMLGTYCFLVGYGYIQIFKHARIVLV